MSKRKAALLMDKPDNCVKCSEIKILNLLVTTSDKITLAHDYIKLTSKHNVWSAMADIIEPRSHKYSSSSITLYEAIKNAEDFTLRMKVMGHQLRVLLTIKTQRSKAAKRRRNE